MIVVKMHSTKLWIIVSTIGCCQHEFVDVWTKHWLELAAGCVWTYGSHRLPHRTIPQEIPHLPSPQPEHRHQETGKHVHHYEHKHFHMSEIPLGVALLRGMLVDYSP